MKKTNILRFPRYHRDDILFKQLVKKASDMESSKNKFEKLEDDFINQMIKNIKHDGLAKKKDFIGLRNVLIKFHKDRIKKLSTKIKIK